MDQQDESGKTGQLIGKQMTDKDKSDKFVMKLRKMEIALTLVKCATENKISSNNENSIFFQSEKFLVSIFKEKDEPSNT